MPETQPQAMGFHAPILHCHISSRTQAQTLPHYNTTSVAQLLKNPMNTSTKSNNTIQHTYIYCTVYCRRRANTWNRQIYMVTHPHPKSTHTHIHTHTHTDTVHGKHFPQRLIFQRQQEMSTSILDGHLNQSDSEEMCSHNIDDSNDECSKTQWTRKMRSRDGWEK